jgi:hypothetical protein
MFSFHDVMDAEVSCVTLTDNLTSWDIPPGTMEYACASVVVYDKKNNGTLVHVHRVLVACSQKNRDFLFLVTQRLGKKKNFCVWKLSTVRECDNRHLLKQQG